MAGYVAAARIERAVVRPIGWADLWADWPTAHVDEFVEPSDAGAVTPPGPDLAERWGRFRDACGQLTWYVLDPQSWR